MLKVNILNKSMKHLWLNSHAERGGGLFSDKRVQNAKWTVKTTCVVTRY
jgi:hypothetical protein